MCGNRVKGTTSFFYLFFWLYNNYISLMYNMYRIRVWCVGTVSKEPHHQGGGLGRSPGPLPRHPSPQSAPEAREVRHPAQTIVNCPGGQVFGSTICP